MSSPWDACPSATQGSITLDLDHSIAEEFPVPLTQTQLATALADRAGGCLIGISTNGSTNPSRPRNGLPGYACRLNGG
jgi:hypothetical protein